MSQRTIRFPDLYKEFSCTGSACEYTCCTGWNISVDQKTMESYKNVKSGFGKRLRSSIDQNGSFLQNEGGCPFLNQKNLCDIYINLGKEHMCKTCRTYPRHVEDYGCLHEVSLSLSCPAAAELILGKMGPDLYCVKRKSVGKNADNNKLTASKQKLLAELSKVREVMFGIIKERSITIEQRMAMVLTLGHDAQKRLKKEQSTAEILDRYTKDGAAGRYEGQYAERLPDIGSLKKRQDVMCFFLEFCGNMEPTVENWHKRMEQTAMGLYGPEAGTEKYDLWQREFKEIDPFYPIYMEHLMSYFLYVYLYGAVYDGDLYTKIKLAVFSCLVIREMNIEVYAKTGTFTERDGVRNAYLYSRELEHSVKNIEMLEKYLSNPAAPSLVELLTCI